jgi:hypothetical protein
VTTTVRWPARRGPQLFLQRSSTLLWVGLGVLLFAIVLPQLGRYLAG